MKTNESLVIFLSRLGILVLFVPMFQSFSGLFKEVGLRGVAEYAENPILSINTWFNEAYQEEKENYWKENFGLLAEMIRLNSSRLFLMYRETNTDDVIISKKGFPISTSLH